MKIGKVILFLIPSLEAKVKKAEHKGHGEGNKKPRKTGGNYAEKYETPTGKVPVTKKTVTVYIPPKDHQVERVKDKYKKIAEPKSLSEQEAGIIEVDMSQQKRSQFEQAYKAIKKEQAELAKELPRPSLDERIKSATKNIPKLARNLYDNTIGFPIALFQNYKTKKYFKKHSLDNQTSLVHAVPGLFQNIGSQQKYAKQLNKAGFKVLHHPGNHHLGRKGSVEKLKESIDQFFTKTGIKEAAKKAGYDPNKYIKNLNHLATGHSSGADVLIDAAEDLYKLGIKAIQARAPAYYGVGKKTLGQKLLFPLAGKSDFPDYNAKLREEIAKQAKYVKRAQKNVPIHVVAGEDDGLITLPEALVEGARHYIVRGKDTTHFGTSGGTKSVNQQFVKHLRNIEHEIKGRKVPPDYKIPLLDYTIIGAPQHEIKEKYKR